MSINSVDEPLRVAFAAGGTGGHIMPALATAEAIERCRPCAFLFIGSKRPSERQLRSSIPYPVVEIPIEGLAGIGLACRLTRLLLLPRAVAVALRHLREFRPNLVISAGGFVAGPVGLAASIQRIPLMLLEQNARPGITTRWLRPFARSAAVAFPKAAAALGCKAVVTGNPIRSSLPPAARRDGRLDNPAQHAALSLLVLGGSQGAHGLNLMMQLSLPALSASEFGLRVVHQSGIAEIETMRDAYQRSGIPATVMGFISDIQQAYATADIVISRAGATTVAELTYCGLPAILVPLPQAAGRHQHANARELAKAGAALIVEEQDVGESLAAAILDLAGNPERIATMAAKSASLGCDGAADAVAELALSLATRPRPSVTANSPTSDDPTETLQC